MTGDAYESALKQALSELAEVERQAAEIERKRATLRESVAVLQTLSGTGLDLEESVTSSIMTILKANPGPLPTTQIIQRLKAMGQTPQPSSVATLLSRLVQQGRIMKANDGYQFSKIDLDNPKTLTDAVLLVIKSRPGAVLATDVVGHLRQWWNGFPFKPQSVESILANHASQWERLIDGRNSKPDGSGIPAYEWREPRTQGEMRKARKSVVDMNLKDLSL